MSVLLDGVFTGEVLGSDGADELDLCCEVTVGVVQHKGMGLDIGNEGLAVLQGAVLGHGVGEEELGGENGILLECDRSFPVCLVRRSVLKEHYRRDGISVLATVIGLVLFKKVDVDVTLLDVLACDRGFAKHEVTVLRNGVKCLDILVCCKEVLIADKGQMHGSASVGEVEGEYPAICSILFCNA